jgi:exonuclease III
MKCIFWNTRGLANTSTRLALKKLINQHNPDIVLISEPWMHFEDFPRRWLVNLNLKLFAMNTRQNKLPNIWCICKLALNPAILAS